MLQLLIAKSGLNNMDCNQYLTKFLSVFAVHMFFRICMHYRTLGYPGNHKKELPPNEKKIRRQGGKTSNYLSSWFFHQQDCSMSP